MSIPDLRQAKNGFYYVHWTEGCRSKRVSTRTRDLAAAKAFLGSWLLMERSAPDVGSDLTVADLWAIYAAKHIATVEAPDTLRYSWKALELHFGQYRPSDIGQDLVDAYVDARLRRVKSGTVRRELVALRACLNWCAAPKRRILASSALPVYDLPPDSAPRDRWLRQDEIDRLLAAASAFYGPEPRRMGRGERFIWLALETAARKQALLDLTWSQVDWEIGVIHLDPPGRKATKKRRPSVPVSARLRPMLERMHKEKINERVLDNGGEVWATIQSIAELAGFGEPRTTPRGTGEKPKGTGVSPHVFRHTAATHMARRGVPLFDIAGVLGNSLAMVEKVYAKHCPGRLRAAVDSISGTVEGAGK